MGQFSHGGKFGDLIYSLPAIELMGGGKLTLHPNPHTGMTMTPDDVAAVAPLIESQGYVESVTFSPHPRGLNLDEMRNHWNDRFNISDMYCAWLGLPFWPRERPWLRVEPRRIARVIIARSPRYRNGDFPWGRVREKYGADIVFVGTPDERRDFCHHHGPVGYYPCQDLLEVAQVLAGCELFVGNQSCPRAIAEGLKLPVVQETDPRNDNCHWGRRYAWYGYRPCVHLPDLGPKPPMSDLLLKLDGVGTALSGVADRGRTMNLLLNEIVGRFENPRIVELGTVRHADDWSGGQFTVVVGTLLEGRGGGHLDSVDSDPRAVETAKVLTSGLGNVTVTASDSVTFLESRTEPIDVLYLDTADDPQQAAREYDAGRGLLHDASLLVVDDTIFGNGAWHGKGAVLVPRLLSEGWHVLASGYQVVLSRGETKAEKLPRLVPFRQFTPELARLQEQHLFDYRQLYRDGGHRDICSLLGAVHEGCADRPELQELILEAVWMARRMDGALQQERIQW